MNVLPLVSIVAVCYNQDKWVIQTLDSIKEQTYPNIQLIIADDGSTDNSKQLIKNWIAENAPGTTFISHEKNIGLTKNINSGLPYIKGNYFQAFGCDDIMLPTKIEQQVATMEDCKSVGIIYSDMYFIDAEGKKLDGSYFQKHVYKKPAGGNLYEALIDRFIISAPSVLIRREVIDKLKGYNETLDYEDHDFFLRAAKSFEFLYVPAQTVFYRITGESLSTTTKSIDLKFARNSFLIFYQNFDTDKEYKSLFEKKLFFYLKKLYALKYKYASGLFFKAFLKTRNPAFLKYSLASLPFYFKK